MGTVVAFGSIGIAPISALPLRAGINAKARNGPDN